MRVCAVLLRADAVRYASTSRCSATVSSWYVRYRRLGSVRSGIKRRDCSLMSAGIISRAAAVARRASVASMIAAVTSSGSESCQDDSPHRHRASSRARTSAVRIISPPSLLTVVARSTYATSPRSTSRQDAAPRTATPSLHTASLIARVCRGELALSGASHRRRGDRLHPRPLHRVGRARGHAASVTESACQTTSVSWSCCGTHVSAAPRTPGAPERRIGHLLV